MGQLQSKQELSKGLPIEGNDRPSSQGQLAGSDAAPEQQEQPLPLLSLPPGVLATHVWPHLGPWARAQLRATCKQLRDTADGLLLGPQLRAILRPKDLKEGPALDTLCATLRRCPSATGLTLLVKDSMPSFVLMSMVDLSDSEFDVQAQAASEALVQALGKLGEAVGKQVSQLAVIPGGRALDRQHVVLSPQVLQSLGTAFPGLTHLSMGPCGLVGQGSEEEWAAALACLPPSLKDLSIDLFAEGSSAMVVKTAFTQVQVAAVERLPALRSLVLGWTHNTAVEADLQALAQAVSAPHAPSTDPLPLQRLSLYGRFTERSVAQALSVPKISEGLRSLSLSLTYVDPGIIAGALAHMPQLQELALEGGAYDGPGPSPELYKAICSLHHLATLAAPTELVGQSDLQLPPPPGPGHGDGVEVPNLALPLPQGLKRLRLVHLRHTAVSMRSGWLPELLLGGRLGPCCHVSRRACHGLGTPFEDAVAALGHPGGTSMALPSEDPLTKEEVVVEVESMVAVNSVNLLQALASAQGGSGTVHGGSTPERQQGARGIRALYMTMGYSADGSAPVGPLHPGPHTAHLPQLHTLAICSPQPAAGLTALTALLKTGQLPALRLLMLHQACVEPGTLERWKGALLQVLAVGQRQGLAVQLLPGRWWPGGYEAVQDLKQGLRDPDTLLLPRVGKGRESCVVGTM